MPTPDLAVSAVFDEAFRADDENRRWDLISHLHLHGGQDALDIAGRLAGDPDPARRVLAADVLGQLGAAPGRAAADGPFRNDAVTLLHTMARDETDPGVLYSVTTGLGHIGDERSLAPLIRLHTHADPEVRHGVVFGLLRRPEKPAVDTLVTLSADEDAHVRDWATFGLARQSDQDFPRLRDALAARLDDEDTDTRIEAVHGLATRGDERVMQPLLDILQDPPESSDSGLVSEALCALAARTADPRLLPHLLAERDSYVGTPIDEWPDDLRAALAAHGEPLPAVATTEYRQ
ncbi:MAG TPA: HEAT repeat domain-containing protein [Actinoplanes sp.]|nr:HEAT repeat domain-containing protein [Actinoplanes sp.]